MYKEKTVGDFIENSVLGSMGIYTGTPGNIITYENHRIAKQLPPFVPAYIPPPPPPPPIIPNQVIFKPATNNPATTLVQTSISKPLTLSEKRADPPLWKLMAVAYIAGLLTPFFVFCL